MGDRHAVLGQQAVEGARQALGLPSGEIEPIMPALGETGAESAEGQVRQDMRSDPPTDAESNGPDGFTLPRPVELVAISDPCRGGTNGTEDGAAVAQAIVEADVDAVVGLLCWSSLEPALREGTLDGLPLVTSGVRAGALTDRRRAEGWDVWRVAPRVEDEGDAVARHIVREWRGQPYAVLDDGTIYGRELAERVTLELSKRGSEPILTEGFRPAVSRQFGLARRLDGAGASHVFVAGERRDVAVIARDAVASGLNLTIMGGDAMRAVDDDVALPAGVEAIVLEPALREGYRQTTRAAVETLLQAEALALDKGFSLEDALNTGEFETAIGPVRFDRRGDLRRNLFEHAVWDGSRWVPSSEANVAPRPDAGASGSAGSGRVEPERTSAQPRRPAEPSSPPVSPPQAPPLAQQSPPPARSAPAIALPERGAPLPSQTRPNAPAPLSVVPLGEGPLQ